VTRSFSLVALSLALTIFAACATQPVRKEPDMLDLKITNGRILDGTGAPWFRGDVGVRGDTIVAIGDLRQLDAKQVIDAQQRIVAPGFIDLLGQSQLSVLVNPHLEAKVRQGVTTEVTGEGHSPGPVKPSTENAGAQTWRTLGEYLDRVEEKGTALNFALLVGASNPRDIVIGRVNREATADEMRQMEAIVDQAMREGAIGLSTSLIYVPAMWSTTEEIVNLARVAAKYDGVYFTHLRDESDQIEPALEEAFRIGREANIPVNVWHLKIGKRRNWGRMPSILEKFEVARAEGLDVAANVYPYIASGTSLSTLAPNWAMEGGYESFRTRLKDPEQRARILEEFRQQYEARGPKGIYVARIGNGEQAKYERKFIEDIAADMKVSVEEALVAIFEANPASPFVMFFSMNEDDLRAALRKPWVSFGADSGSPTPNARASKAAVHPRGYGTFARILGRYTRDEKLMTLEEAVRRMTSLAASRAKIFDRGVLRSGMKADIVVFDPATIRDVSTYDDPHHFSEGVSDVVVNGTAVMRDGVMATALPGRVLRGKGYVKTTTP
jgi:N-acyl-D-amino-acid deacylase